MKRKILAAILSVIMIFSCGTVAFASDVNTEQVKTVGTNVLLKTLGFAVDTILKAVNIPFKENSAFKSEKDYTYDNFFEGTKEFITEGAKDGKWSLGYSTVSLVPENFEDYNLFLGGFISGENFFTNDVKMVLDDMKVRVIALNDGSKRGTAVFATVDAIGVSNGDIRHIRGLLNDFAQKNNLNSINIFSTHVHSGIDTQGMWTDIFKKWPRNLFASFLGNNSLQVQGTDPEYMEFFYGKMTEAIKQAVSSMTEGEMTFSRKDIGEKYFNNKNRPSATSMDTELKRFVFTPYDKSLTPTIILNMAAHPDTAGLAVGDEVNGHGISGDYVYYLGETINGAGYNLMFFNGAICGIYIGRVNTNTKRRVDICAHYGREVGSMTLAMTKTKEEVLSDEYLMSLTFKGEEIEGKEYTPWYENWTPVKEEAVEPILNIRINKVEIPVTNSLILLAGKGNLVNYSIKRSGKNYSITTEIGYIEMGKNIKIAMVPGEFCSDLAYGGASLTKEGSVNMKDFEEKTLCEIFGDDVIVFGLANDAIGYILPDNDYVSAIDFGHYAETISLGRNTASTLSKAFQKIAE